MKKPHSELIEIEQFQECLENQSHVNKELKNVVSALISEISTLYNAIPGLILITNNADCIIEIFTDTAPSKHMFNTKKKRITLRKSSRISVLSTLAGQMIKSTASKFQALTRATK